MFRNTLTPEFICERSPLPPQREQSRQKDFLEAAVRPRELGRHCAAAVAGRGGAQRPTSVRSRSSKPRRWPAVTGPPFTPESLPAALLQSLPPPLG